MSETDPQHPDLEEMHQAIASGDPVQAIQAITQPHYFQDASEVSFGPPLYSAQGLPR